MNSKRSVPWYWFGMVMVGLFALGSCAPAAPAPAAPPKEYRFSMGTGGTAGTYYPFGGAISSIWSKYIPGLSVTVEATGGAVENMRLLEKKQVEVALTQNDIADYSYNGTEMFKDKAIKTAALAATYLELIQIVVPADSDIKTGSDIKGKRVTVGPPGSGTEVNARQVLEAAGVTYKDFGKQVNLSYAEAAAQFKDRLIDVWMTTIGAPAPVVQDVGLLRPVRILPITGEWKAAIQKKYPFLVDATVPAKAYRGQDDAVPTVSVVAILVVREDMDSELAYKMTKVLLDKREEIAQAHAKGKDIDPKTITRGITVPFHPGAVKYYKEQGLMK